MIMDENTCAWAQWPGLELPRDLSHPLGQAELLRELSAVNWPLAWLIAATTRVFFDKM